MPANTMATVTTWRGADKTMPRTAADKSPERSATPTPSIATSTTPNGAKLVKFVTRLVKIMRMPSAFNRLTARIMPSSDTPRVPAGLGSSTASPIQPNTPERRTIPRARTANKVTGCGRKLPNHSTVSRKRVKALRRLGGSGVGAFVIGWVFVLHSVTSHYQVRKSVDWCGPQGPISAVG